MIPSRCADPSKLLVIVDVSWWQVAAWSAATSGEDDAVKSANKMISILCGWISRLLSGPCAAYVVAACDSRGPTWRHAMTSHLPEAERYKAGRESRPKEYWAEVDRFERILALHKIPRVRAEGWEADDVAATLTRQATAQGIEVALYSRDKDWRALCSDTVYEWLPATKKEPEVLIGPAEVLASKTLGVEPWQIPHLLALVGDKSDGIKGVEGIGPTKARPALAMWGDVHRALAVEADARNFDALIKVEAKAMAKAKKDAREGDRIMSECAIESLRSNRDLEKTRATIVTNRERVLLDLQLATLDEDAPVDLDLEAARVGDFNRAALRTLYTGLGFTGLADDVSEAA